MDEFEKFLRRCSKRLNGSVKSVQVYDQEILVAVVMNKDRYLSAIYSQKIKARKRVYRKTHDALVVRTIRVDLPDKITLDQINDLLGDEKKFKPIFFERTRYSKVSVCISPRSFRLLRKAASIKMTHNKMSAYMTSLPLRRKDGDLVVTAALREV